MTAIDTKIQDLMRLADEFARACFDTDGGAHDARAALESALRSALQREPLTEEQLRTEYRRRWGSPDPRDLLNFDAGVRWAERAHGIDSKDTHG
jgi:hypothetical protein